MANKEPSYENTLTNEVLYKRFKNQFDLVNYAFELARSAVHSGRKARVSVRSDNPAYQVLCEIAANRDILEDLPETIKK